MSHPMIRQIVNRCHVSDSNRKVIRYVISRLKAGFRTYRKMSRSQRHTLMRQVIEVHERNRELYRRVMSGRL